LDLTVLTCLAPLILPLFVLVGFAVRLVLGSPVFFRQNRPGLGAVPFQLIKFRTMTNARTRDGHLLKDGERLGRFGRFLRSTSLDELPEVLNVVRGEMSLVGPRPLLMQYLGRYTPEQARRHEVLPGITGLVQVRGRNALTWDEKFRLDVWYVDHWCLWLDLKILATTVLKVITREGIHEPGHDTVEEFLGSDP
jgi:lipopolysaccharide/colanic/teichoic acid biosynthesis glycosyltransferase